MPDSNPAAAGPPGGGPQPLTVVPGVGRPTAPEDLLHAVARGDSAAFAEFYDQFAPRVLGLAIRVVRDPSQAEEVAQEVFLEAWQQASRYDRSRGSVQGWLFTLTHRRAVDRVRSAQASADREQRVAAASTERDVDVVSDQVEAGLERRAVQRCLSTLTDLQRESITLAYYSGYSYREVAQLLSAPLPTVKTRMRDGLIRLRDCLGVAS